MRTLPVDLLPFIVEFQPFFSKSVWENAQVLLTGAILAIGKRTITACLRIMGKSDDPHFQNYHRVLNRAQWPALALSRVLLKLLIKTFAPKGTLLFGIDGTLERRRGDKISAKGIYHDPLRSSKSHFAKASGLRWLSCMLLVKIPWAAAVWALPFLTVLCPSARYYEKRGRQGQTLNERAWQLIQLVARWLPDRTIVFVADSSFAAIKLLQLVSGTPNVSLITRLRLDAALFDPPPLRRPGERGRPRVKGDRRPSLKDVLTNPKTVWTKLEIKDWYGEGKRTVEVCTETALWWSRSHRSRVIIRWVLIRDPQGEFEPQALLSTKLPHTPLQILTWFIQRWRLEVTFEESKAHLGIETQRQWNDLAIARTTPCLYGLFSVVTLMADALIQSETTAVRQAAWYTKEHPTFSDAIAIVRRCVWSSSHFSMSSRQSDVVKIPRSILERLTDAVCYAA
jgi:DDE superfamily endonuclease